MISKSQPLSERAVLFLRLGVGFFIGLIVAFLIADEVSRSADTLLRQDWREVLAQTLTLVAFILWAGAAVMRRVSLAIWSAIAAAMLCIILWHVRIYSGDGNSSELQSILILLALTFIANELVSSADQAGKPFAPYELYFDEAWKRGVQLILAIGFTLLFWGILQLGAALLGFIGFKWLHELLQHEFFALPITGLAFASAVHLGDIQPKLLANVRGLALGVLAWLLPVIALIGTIFAVSLAFSGLQPLWDTKAATATLLGACIGFVLLINAAFQQGESDRNVHVVLKWCVRLAALLLLVFAVLAAWSLGLRINQYGLTIDRTLAGMVVVIALAYGLGYSTAVFWRGPWMELLKPLNIGLAVFKCVVFIAILTPLASPARLSVDNQVKRLTSGLVKPEKFDWFVLSADTGQYGKTALDKLVTSSDPSIANWAKRAKKGELERRRYDRDAEFDAVEAKPADLSRLQIISPKGAKLPASFLEKDFTTLPGYVVPRCLMYEPTRDIDRCTVALLNIDREQGDEVVILSPDEGVSVFKLTPKGWVGLVQSVRLYDESSHEAFKRGDVKAAEPELRDLVLGGRRVHLRPVGPEATAAAAEDTSPPSKP